MQTTKPLQFATLFPTARKEYECYGCGEVPIFPGTPYMLSRERDGNGTFHTARYCFRCACALQSSLAHTNKAKVVSKGDLKYRRLSTRFRRAWEEMIKGFSQGENEKAKNEFMETMGIEGLNVGRRTMEEMEKSKEMRTKRIFRKDARQLKAFRRETENSRQLLLDMMSELAKLHIAETTAWINGDSEEIEKAKDAYGQYAKVIIKKIEGMKTENANEQ